MEFIKIRQIVRSLRIMLINQRFPREEREIKRKNNGDKEN